MRTYSAKKEDVVREWFIVDAQGKTLGRLATRVANLLRGKHKAIYTPHVDTGDYVIVVNASKVKVTGKKNTDKMYYRHSGYVGGLKAVDLKTLLSTKPTQVIREAVRGMVPKNHLGRQMLKKLKVYSGKEHPHRKHNLKNIEF